MNYYERHIGDYLKDTAHLSLLQHGVYARLLDVYYTREAGIPDADAARLIGARTKEERAAVAEVLAEFFTATDGVWSQGRCDAEIARFKDKQNKARRSAEARWGDSGRNANASSRGDAESMRAHCDGNAPTHHTPDSSLQSKETHTVPATAAGRVCLLMRRAGVQDGNSGHPDLLALIAAGATDEEFSGAAQAAAGKGKGFAYALGMLKRQRQEAAKTAETMHNGPLPQDRKSRQLEGAAILTGAKRQQETIDVESRIIPA